MSYTTIWEIPDELWDKIEPLLPPEKPSGSAGRPALPNRQVMNGILHVLRTGCQWKSLKKEWFGASSSLHARFQAWQTSGLFAHLFRELVMYYQRRKRIYWRWQSIDSKSVPAPLGGEQTGKNPTDRGKLGSKRHILVDGRGAPLAVIVTGAQAHDSTCAIDLLDRTVVPRPTTKYRVQHLCADKGYDSESIRQEARVRNYRVHVRKREYGNKIPLEPLPEIHHPTRCWVVERDNSCKAIGARGLLKHPGLPPGARNSILLKSMGTTPVSCSTRNE